MIESYRSIDPVVSSGWSIDSCVHILLFMAVSSQILHNLKHFTHIQLLVNTLLSNLFLSIENTINFKSMLCQERRLIWFIVDFFPVIWWKKKRKIVRNVKIWKFNKLSQQNSVINLKDVFSIFDLFWYSDCRLIFIAL